MDSYPSPPLASNPSKEDMLILEEKPLCIIDPNDEEKRKYVQLIDENVSKFRNIHKKTFKCNWCGRKFKQRGLIYRGLQATEISNSPFKLAFMILCPSTIIPYYANSSNIPHKISDAIYKQLILMPNEQIFHDALINYYTENPIIHLPAKWAIDTQNLDNLQLYYLYHMLIQSGYDIEFRNSHLLTI